MTCIHIDDPRPIRRTTAVDLARNLALFAALWLAYSMIRSAVGDAEGIALGNARRLLDAQSSLGLAIEDDIQRVLGTSWTFATANVYYLVHFPVTVAVLFGTFLRDRHGSFVLLRDSLIAVTAIALVVHLVVPMAPPRMLPGFIDAGVEYGPDPYSIAGSDGANQFAAMPSMHVAWALLVGVALWSVGHVAGLRVFALVHPVITTVVVILTGHHFVFDAAAGAALVGVALVARSVACRRRQRSAGAVTVEVGGATVTVEGSAPPGGPRPTPARSGRAASSAPS